MFMSSGRMLSVNKKVTPVIPDPSFANVSLLMHMDNGTFPDVKGHAITKVGTPVASSAFSAFGSSLLLNGTTDYLSSPSSAGFQLGSGDYTVELWMKVTGAGTTFGYQPLGTSDGQTATGWAFLVNRTGSNPGGLLWVIGNVIALNFTTQFAVGDVHRIAVDRFGTGANNTTLYIDGNVVAQVNNTFNDTNTLPLMIGSQNASGGATQFFPGYLDEVRITKGVARYKGSNYTVAATPFANQ